MFDLSYESMLELVKGLREYVKKNPSENNMREMIRALMETDAVRDADEHENDDLLLEELYWLRRLNEEYPKEEYEEMIRSLESGN